MDAEFTYGTLAIDNDGVVTVPLFCDDKKVQVTVVIPQGVLGDYTSFEHTKIWNAFRRVKERVEAVVKEKCGGMPTEACTITLEKADLPAYH